MYSHSLLFIDIAMFTILLTHNEWPSVGMGRTKIFRLALIAALLALISKSNSQYPPTFRVPAYPAPRPLCLSQFLLVNRACSSLPYSSVPPPSPPSPPPPIPSPPSPPSPNSPPSRHHHKHHHRHRHGIQYQESPAEADCCRWLKQIDTQCVCDLLVYLPVFLAKPRHNYTVSVAQDCTVTYQCPSRVIV